MVTILALKLNRIQLIVMESKKQRKTIFPKDFLWGASTASHQVEGGNYNQWTVWELENAKRLASTAQKRLGWMPSWDLVEKRATSPSNYVSGEGIDHYHRYEHDFDIAEKLNINSLRFGIEWSRLEPEMGKWDNEQIIHYKKYIKAMTTKGMTPVLNLWHWTLPTWFSDNGGFKNRANLVYWQGFVQKVADELLTDIDYVITLNEPNVYASFGYLNGEWPPQEKNLISMARVYWNLTRAHKQAYAIVKAKNPKIQIGIAAQLANIQAKRPHNMIDSVVTKIMRYVWNWWFLHRINNQQDFVGFNYYFTDYYKGFKRANPAVPVNDLGWYMEPEGIYPLLLRVWSRFKKPIMIAENGTADEGDEYRQWWIGETIVAMERAISEGVDVIGYFHWSLLDNFEWAYGWWPKFGLIAVDRNTMKRQVRKSALWYAEQIIKR